MKETERAHLKGTAIATAQQKRLLGSNHLARLRSSMTYFIGWPHRCPQQLDLELLPLTGAICTEAQQTWCEFGLLTPLWSPLQARTPPNSEPGRRLDTACMTACKRRCRAAYARKCQL